MSFDPQTPSQPSPPTNAPSQDAAIILQDVSEVFEIYDRPVHRLLQMLCRGRRRFYRSFEALHHIDLTIRKGECVGIVGRNGAGKSTLLQIITGTLAPTTGSVRTCGRVAALLELGYWQGTVENILYLGLPAVEELVFSGRWKTANHRNRRQRT